MAGLPAISGMLLPFFLHQLWSFVVDLKQKTFNTTTNNKHKHLLHHPRNVLMIIIISYVCFHSISAHKEFRFIMPILPLVCVLAGFSISTVTSVMTMKDKIKYSDSSISTTNKSSKRLWLILVVIATVLLNYPHLLFLSMIHQRAPISVNKAVVNQIRMMETELFSNNETKSIDIQDLDDEHPIAGASSPYSVHYLMGCHSLPLYSHLHIPTHTISNQPKNKISIDAWALDCSPKCRADPTIQCESDNFLSNPARFMQMTYSQLELSDSTDNHCTDENNKESDHTDNVCTINNSRNDVSQTQKSCRPIPHVLLMHENEVLPDNVQDLLQAMKLVEVSRCWHTITSVRMLNVDDDVNSSIRFRILGVNKVVKISFEHVIVFVKLDGKR